MKEYFIFIRWDGQVEWFENFTAAEMRKLEDTVIDCTITEWVQGSGDDVMIICDESGAMKPTCPPNFKASLYYNGTAAGQFICGNVILAKRTSPYAYEGYVGFSAEEFTKLYTFLTSEEIEIKTLLWNAVINKDPYFSGAVRLTWSQIQQRITAVLEGRDFRVYEKMAADFNEAMEAAQDMLEEKRAIEGPTEWS